MQTVMLYGQLGQKFGRVHRYEVRTPAEAVRALSSTIKGFKKYVMENGVYRVIVGGKEDLELNQLANPVSEKETIRIVPVIGGASGFSRVLIGAALIVASIYFPPAGAAAAGGAAAGAGAGAAAGFSFASVAASIGVSLVLSGVSSMLFKPPSTNGDDKERPENRPSFLFNGAVNTSRQGNPVPLCYGQMVVGSQVISSGLSVEQI